MVQSRYALVLIFMLSCLGVIGLALATRWGIGASPDSVVYIGGARMIASGKGYTSPDWDGQGEPVTHFPPFFSLALALGDVVGIDPLQGARWLNLLLFALNAIFFGLALLRQAVKPAWLPIFGAFLTLTALPMLTIHSRAWSEPLFLLLGSISLWLLAEHLQTQSRMFFFASALLAGLALLTRYAGIVLIGAACLGLLTLGTNALRRRITAGIGYGGLSLLPGLIWIVRNQWVSGTAANREVVFHPINAARLTEGMRTMAGWMLIPASIPSPWLVGLFLTIAACILVISLGSIRRFGSQNRISLKEQLKRLPIFHGLVGIFILAYLGFLVVSITFIDANTPLDDRILAPIFWGGAFLALSLGMRLAAHGPRSLRWILILGLTVYTVGYGSQAVKFFREGFENGLGLNSRVWQRSATMAQVKRLPSGTPIYTSAAEAIYLHTNHPAQRLPRKIELVTGLANPEYEKSLQEMGERITRQNGVLVIFDFFKPAGYPPIDELRELLPLRVLITSADGTIYASENGP